MKYEVTEAGPWREELWNEKTVRVYSGGFNIDPEDFPRSETHAKKGLAFAIDFATRKATPVKTVALASALGGSATAVVVPKGHIISVGDIIGTADASATVTAIADTDAATDTLTISAALGALPQGTVLTSSTAAGEDEPLLVANILNYADVKLEGKPSISGIYAADEVREGRLPYPLTAAIKESLTVRFLFIP